MIELHAKIHDRFSIEFKIGFVARRRMEISNFVMNTWIFIPGALDINPLTYRKDTFYRDIKSYLRLITPVYPLRDIADTRSGPFRALEESFHRLSSSPGRQAAADHESCIKMFASILKSALRDELAHIKQNTIEEDRDHLCREYLRDIRAITTAYRSLRRVINVSNVPATSLERYRFGDEFISNAVEQNTHKLLLYLRDADLATSNTLEAEVTRFLRDELAYKKARGYPHVREESDDRNRDFVSRAGLLKKYIEGDLFLSARKRSTTFVVEQVLFSLAAGVAMVFATAVAFAVQREYGNFTMPLFVALVVSYMMKDRIKDLMRHYFAHHLGARFFDHKIQISREGKPIGWSKEGVDFITDGKVPREVMELRERPPLLKAGTRGGDEKIILHRKRVQFKRKRLVRLNDHRVPGIHDITRFNISEFCRKMDNPEVPLFFTADDGEQRLVRGDKVYYLNFVMQCRYEEQLEYKRYRVIFNRNGIIDLESF
jgi:hypothetical protein